MKQQSSPAIVKQSNASGRHLHPTVDVVEFSNEQAQQYGGIWYELHERVASAVAAQKETEAELQQIRSERDALLVEKEILTRKFTENLSSLTMKETSNLEYRQILDEIRQERQLMVDRVNALQSHIEWHEKQNKELVTEVNDSKKHMLTLQQENQELGKQVQGLNNELIRKEEEYNRECCKLNESREKETQHLDTIRLLKRSIAVKDTQLMAMVREKNNLQQKFDERKKTPPPVSKDALKNPKVKGNISADGVEKSITARRSSSIIVRAGTMTNAKKNKILVEERSLSNIIANAATEASNSKDRIDISPIIADHLKECEVSDTNPWGIKADHEAVSIEEFLRKEKDYQSTIYLLQLEIKQLRKHRIISNLPIRTMNRSKKETAAVTQKRGQQVQQKCTLQKFKLPERQSATVSVLTAPSPPPPPTKNSEFSSIIEMNGPSFTM